MVAHTSTPENGGVVVDPGWQSTARLWLRQPTPTDAPACCGSSRSIGGRAQPVRSGHGVVRDRGVVGALAQALVRAWLRQLLRVRESDRPADRQLRGPLDDGSDGAGTQPHVPLRPSRWGRGYASEASRTVLDWTLENLPGQVVLTRARPGKLASQAVARKIGLRRDPLFDDEGEDGLDWAFTNRSRHGSPMRPDR